MLFVLARDGAQVLRSSMGSEFSSFRTLEFKLLAEKATLARATSGI